MFDEHNSKNYLQNFIQSLGHLPDVLLYQTTGEGTKFHSHVTLNILDKNLSGSGEGSNKKEAEKNAADCLLQSIYKEHPELKRDWDSIFVEAQAGDALIKLGIYLSKFFETAAEKSYWLQKFETDEKMVEIYDYLKAKGDPRLQIFGNNLGKKKKATYIEAMIWRDYGKPFNEDETKEELYSLIDFIKGFK